MARSPGLALPKPTTGTFDRNIDRTNSEWDQERYPLAVANMARLMHEIVVGAPVVSQLK